MVIRILLVRGSSAVSYPLLVRTVLANRWMVSRLGLCPVGLVVLVTPRKIVTLLGCSRWVVRLVKVVRLVGPLEDRKRLQRLLARWASILRGLVVTRWA